MMREARRRIACEAAYRASRCHGRARASVVPRSSRSLPRRPPIGRGWPKETSWCEWPHLRRFRLARAHAIERRHAGSGEDRARHARCTKRGVALRISYDVVAFGGAHAVRLANDDVEIIASTDYGPRIVSYKLRDGENVFGFVDPAVQAKSTPFGEPWHIYGGHRVWHAPEDPVRTYVPDNSQVRASFDGKTLTLTGSREKATSLVKELRITLANEGSRVVVEHRIVNHADRDVELAVWGLSLMRQGGRALVPSPPFAPHPEALLPSRRIVAWPYTRLDDPRFRFGARLVSIAQDPLASTPQKLGFWDAHCGWAAYACGDDLFVKRFACAADARVRRSRMQRRGIHGRCDFGARDARAARTSPSRGGSDPHGDVGPVRRRRCARKRRRSICSDCALDQRSAFVLASQSWLMHMVGSPRRTTGTLRVGGPFTGSVVGGFGDVGGSPGMHAALAASIERERRSTSAIAFMRSMLSLQRIARAAAPNANCSRKCVGWGGPRAEEPRAQTPRASAPATNASERTSYFNGVNGGAGTTSGASSGRGGKGSGSLGIGR